MAVEEEPEQLLRIGELSRRVDVEPALLRAWEKRYGLLEPQRSDGNFRLYSSEDVSRVWAMKRHLARGLAAAEAARLAKAEASAPQPVPSNGNGSGGTTPGSDRPAEELFRALVDLDEGRAHELLDRYFTLHSLDEAIGQIILPCLRRIGEAWGTGEITVGQEHSASSLLRNRLLSIGRGWKAGEGPTAMLACPSGEQHDIGLVCFGLLLWRHGWRIDYIGPDVPATELVKTLPTSQPDLIVLAALTSEPFEGALTEMRALAAHAPLLLAGSGATPAIASRCDGVLLDGDPVRAAQELASGVPA